MGCRTPPFNPRLYYLHKMTENLIREGYRTCKVYTFPSIFVVNEEGMLLDYRESRDAGLNESKFLFSCEVDADEPTVRAQVAEGRLPPGNFITHGWSSPNTDLSPMLYGDISESPLPH